MPRPLFKYAKRRTHSHTLPVPLPVAVDECVRVCVCVRPCSAALGCIFHVRALAAAAAAGPRQAGKAAQQPDKQPGQDHGTMGLGNCPSYP